jgi:hypothetical protein
VAPEGHVPVILKPHKTRAVVYLNRRAAGGSGLSDGFGGGDQAASEFRVSVDSDAESRGADNETQPGESGQAEPAAGSSSADPPKEATVLDDTYYTYQGDMCRKKTHADVNAARSIEDIQEYVASVKDDIPSAFTPGEEIPYRSIQDYATILRVAGSSANSAFQWSYGSLCYRKAVDVAFHHCAPGYMVVF